MQASVKEVVMPVTKKFNINVNALTEFKLLKTIAN